MKITSIVFAQSLRFVNITRPVYMPDVIKSLQERYGFVKLPRTAEEILPADETTPAVLAHGKFVHDGREILIKGLRLYQQAIAVDTPLSTDDSDLVLDDLIRSASGLLAENTEQPKIYMNQLELTFEPPLEWACRPAAQIGVTMAKMIAGYVPNAPPDAYAPGFRISALGMKIDPAQFALPCDFRIERRINVPYGANVYFSQAPLRTNDHIEALRQFVGAVRALGQPTNASASEPQPPSGQSPSAS